LILEGATAEKVKSETTTSSRAAGSKKSSELAVADLASNKVADVQFKDFIDRHAIDLKTSNAILHNVK